MKQTAVEWFQDQIIKIVNGTCELSEIQIFEQSKEMFKQQIVDAYIISHISMMSAEQYYYETFKQQENETNSI